MTVRRFSLYRFLYLRTEFLAVLGTKLVGTFAALQCSVGMIPKTLGVHHHAQFPHQSGHGR